MSYRDKLRLAQLLIQLARKEEEQQNPEQRAPRAIEGEFIAKFLIGDHVRKTKGSSWNGRVVGTYSTDLTPEGYAVERSSERGSG